MVAAAAATLRPAGSAAIPALPVLAKDYTDRNRTSPMAFTGNKFEFRAVGSGQAIAVPLKVIQTLVGDSLSWMNQRVRELEGKQIDRRQALMEVIREVVTLTKAVRFDGNGYSAQWREEAERRGLPHAKNTVEALAAWEQPKTQELFVRAGVMATLGPEARIHVRHEPYAKRPLTDTPVRPELAGPPDPSVRGEALGNHTTGL